MPHIILNKNSNEVLKTIENNIRIENSFNITRRSYSVEKHDYVGSLNFRRGTFQIKFKIGRRGFIYNAIRGRVINLGDAESKVIFHAGYPREIIALMVGLDLLLAIAFIFSQISLLKKIGCLLFLGFVQMGVMFIHNITFKNNRDDLLDYFRSLFRDSDESSPSQTAGEGKKP